MSRGEIWTDAESIAALLDHVQLQYRVDPNAVYLTGHSMGGHGALYLAYKMPQRFAAVAALSPVSPITAWAGGLRGVPPSIIHGGKDEIAPVAETDELVQAIKKAGGDLQFTRLDERDHFILDQYEGDEIFRWLSAHRKAAPENASDNEAK
ncbi:MAG: prolyl oligopeptidase family serine peptidase [Chthoniobacterales bacterium]|nr:prolyl oligopeptidase family serine peptidase [Chthoniobacterales bacterium]